MEARCASKENEGLPCRVMTVSSLALWASSIRVIRVIRGCFLLHRGGEMAKKWTTAELTVGALMEATFWPNPVRDSGFRFRATHLDGRKAPKVVLCDDVRIRPGIPCQV